MKKLVLLLALVGFAFQTSSCKSKKNQDDTQIVENADVEKIEAEDAELLSASDTDTNVGPVDDSLQAALGEAPTEIAADPELTTAETAVTETTTAASQDIAAAPVLDEDNLDEVPAPVTTPTDSMASNITTETSIAETPMMTETPVIETPAAEPALAETKIEAPVSEAPMVMPSETTAATQAPVASSNVLRKIAETTPYQHGEGWVNTVYIARPKEKLKDISQKIYAADKTKELKSINSFLAARSPRGGDKIYYVSPNRPADSMKTISFYEDTGMVAETYVAKKGDNLQKVAKNLLGYDNAYKEMWTTNNVASKNRLDEGETLRYWRPATTSTESFASNTGAAQVIESKDQLPTSAGQAMAKNEFAAPPPQAELPPPPPPMPEQTEFSAPPADQMAQNMNQPQAELPPPPPPPDMSAADAAALLPPPPPPPPTEDLAAAPVEPQKKVVTPNMEEESAVTEEMSQDTTMMLGGVVVLCALFAFALVRRNKKKKEVEMASMSETNVGT